MAYLVGAAILCIIAAALVSLWSSRLRDEGARLANVSESDLLNAVFPGPLIRGQERGRRLLESANAWGIAGWVFGIDSAILFALLVPSLPITLDRLLWFLLLVSPLVIIGRFMAAWRRHRESRRSEEAIAQDFE